MVGGGGGGWGVCVCVCVCVWGGGGGGGGCKMRYFDPRVELGYLLVVSIKAL